MASKRKAACSVSLTATCSVGEEIQTQILIFSCYAVIRGK